MVDLTPPTADEAFLAEESCGFKVYVWYDQKQFNVPRTGKQLGMTFHFRKWIAILTS